METIPKDDTVHFYRASTLEADQGKLVSELWCVWDVGNRRKLGVVCIRLQRPLLQLMLASQTPQTMISRSGETTEGIFNERGLFSVEEGAG
jgi:hypothetical protein